MPVSRGRAGPKDPPRTRRSALRPGAGLPPPQDPAEVPLQRGQGRLVARGAAGVLVGPEPLEVLLPHDPGEEAAPVEGVPGTRGSSGDTIPNSAGSGGDGSIAGTTGQPRSRERS